jgi:hypothetical protein
MRLFRGKRSRLHEIGESEAYGRTYGDRTGDVKSVKLPPKRPRYELKVSGETLREAFARKLDQREQEEAEKK